MSNLADRPISPRGQRTKEALVLAGTNLLADGGWEAVTTRAVAALASSNAGLIHYHFGGLAGLRVAIAQYAGEIAIGPIIGVFLESDDFTSALASLRSAIAALASDDRRVKLATELVAGAGHDPALGESFRAQLVDARAALTAWVARQRPHWPTERVVGVAALLAALLDGLLLQRAVDESTPVNEVLMALGMWLELDAPPQASGTEPS
ncbi:TetR/AcrR family transcriptional regulator [Microbacterium nymphoidis]|uniref:TetR/AcrR family transcriptional regulator n=1 Tax=Microbacterium nymphoidis TaxID=2898586 RepID=UPI001E445D3C|nr:TetR family transcriptional regulator [Microbacterium nymphoidis]MCD2498351.1 TetR family transcriptional regulator [Microbacterium nymphoidis]